MDTLNQELRELLSKPPVRHILPRSNSIEKADREWFTQHTGRKKHIRQARSGELSQHPIEDKLFRLAGAWILVTCDDVLNVTREVIFHNLKMLEGELITDTAIDVLLELMDEADKLFRQRALAGLDVIERNSIKIIIDGVEI